MQEKLTGQKILLMSLAHIENYRDDEMLHGIYFVFLLKRKSLSKIINQFRELSFKSGIEWGFTFINHD